MTTLTKIRFNLKNIHILSAKKKGNQKIPKKITSHDIYCFKCDRYGHLQEDCIKCNNYMRLGHLQSDCRACTFCLEGIHPENKCLKKVQIEINKKYSESNANERASKA